MNNNRINELQEQINIINRQIELLRQQEQLRMTQTRPKKKIPKTKVVPHRG